MAAKTLPQASLLRQLLDYDPETGILTWRKRPYSMFRLRWDCDTWNKTNAGKPISSIGGNGYIRVSIGHIRYLAHRIIFKMVVGREPKAQIDHINGIKTDNRWCNLREATHAENLWNQGPYRCNKTGLKGVSHASCWPGHYAAEICANGKRKRLGYFKTPQEAHAAYCEAAEMLHAEYANIGARTP